MLTAFVLLTNDCSRGCAWCYNQFYPPAAGARLQGAAAVVVPRLKQLGVQQLIFSGGEPAEVAGLGDWLQQATAAGLLTALVTNGEGLTAARVAAWCEAGLTMLTCSLPSVADAELPTVDGVLADAQARLQAVRDGGLEAMTLLACVTRHNFEHIAALIDWSAREHAGLLLQPLYLPADHPEVKRSLAHITGAEWAELDAILRPWAESNHCGGYYQLWIDLYLELGASPISCFMGSEGMVVDPDGSVFPCFHRRDLPCGNLFDDEPRDLILKLFAANDKVIDAPCFGRHCLSLFTDR